MESNPYDKLPDYAFWKSIPSGALDPVVDVPFRIGPREKIATAGSCFAEHISRYLKAGGYNYLITEPAHPLLGEVAAQRANYGRFTARYGNIYTPRQLLQLFDRAYSRFAPQEDIWQEKPDVFIDPFRPQIQPRGFISRRELILDRAQHLAAVRKAFETLDVFIFTLGLTECWRSRLDGAVFPLCPGVRGGSFCEQRHEFVNFDVEEVVEDMSLFIDRLRSINPLCKLVLTVSPVPLAATAVRRHVLLSTTYSKAVLRIACEKLTRGHDSVAYFPAYEIITGASRGGYFGADGRSITEAGVAHVMRVFSGHYLSKAVRAARDEDLYSQSERHVLDVLESAFRVMCDEESLLLRRSGNST